MKPFNKDEKTAVYLKRIAIGCFVAAVVLSIIAYLLTLSEIQESFYKIEEFFYNFEMFIAKYENWEALIVIFFIYAVRSIVPFVPFSVIFVATGMVFDSPFALLVNTMGFALLCAVKFLWGRKFGGGSMKKLILHSKTITEFMDLNGKGNKWMLPILRLVPFVPLAAVSKAYGATEMKMSTFMALSVLGFLPRLIIWSIVGFNMSKPLTAKFFIPFIILAVMSGISLFGLRMLVIKNSRKEVNNE